jgi:hypothetical protein
MSVLDAANQQCVFCPLTYNYCATPSHTDGLYFAPRRELASTQLNTSLGSLHDLGLVGEFFGFCFSSNRIMSELSRYFLILTGAVFKIHRAIVPSLDRADGIQNLCLNRQSNLPTLCINHCPQVIP